MDKKLRNLRIEKGVTQKQVAQAIGITKSAYANYEQGNREPSNQILKSLCQYFNVSADYLLGLKDFE